MLSEDRFAWIGNIAFGLSGIFYVLTVQWLDYAGLGKTEAGLTLLAIFAGQAIISVPLLFRNDLNHRRAYSRVFWVMALLNLLGELAGQICVLLCGSAVFIILYRCHLT